MHDNDISPYISFETDREPLFQDIRIKSTDLQNATNNCNELSKRSVVNFMTTTPTATGAREFRVVSKTKRWNDEFQQLCRNANSCFSSSFFPSAVNSTHATSVKTKIDNLNTFIRKFDEEMWHLTIMLIDQFLVKSNISDVEFAKERHSGVDVIVLSLYDSGDLDSVSIYVNEQRAQHAALAQQIAFLSAPLIGITLRSVIYYKGWTVIAALEVPPSSPPVTADKSLELRCVLNLMIETFNFSRLFACSKGSWNNEYLHGLMAGVTCFTGRDGRLYFGTLKFLFPHFPPNEDIQHIRNHVILRPELVNSLLQTDTRPLSLITIFDHIRTHDTVLYNIKIGKSAALMCHSLIPNLVKDFIKKTPASITDILETMSSRGVHVNCLGLLLWHISPVLAANNNKDVCTSNNGINTESMNEKYTSVFTMVFTEMVARALRDKILICMSEQTDSKTTFDKCVKKILAEFNGDDAVGFFECTVFPLLKSSFMEVGTLFQCCDTGGAELNNGLISKVTLSPNDVNQHLLLKRVSNLLGIKFASSVIAGSPDPSQYTINKITPVTKGKSLRIPIPYLGETPLDKLGITPSSNKEGLAIRHNLFHSSTNIQSMVNDLIPLCASFEQYIISREGQIAANVRRSVTGTATERDGKVALLSDNSLIDAVETSATANTSAIQGTPEYVLMLFDIIMFLCYFFDLSSSEGIFPEKVVVLCDTALVQIRNFESFNQELKRPRDENVGWEDVKNHHLPSPICGGGVKSILISKSQSKNKGVISTKKTSTKRGNSTSNECFKHNSVDALSYSSQHFSGLIRLQKTRALLASIEGDRGVRRRTNSNRIKMAAFELCLAIKLLGPASLQFPMPSCVDSATVESIVAVFHRADNSNTGYNKNGNTYQNKKLFPLYSLDAMAAAKELISLCRKGSLRPASEGDNTSDLYPSSKEGLKPLVKYVANGCRVLFGDYDKRTIEAFLDVYSELYRLGSQEDLDEAQNGLIMMLERTETLLNDNECSTERNENGSNKLEKNKLILVILGRLAAVYGCQGKYIDAQDLIKKCIAFTTSRHGPYHLAVAYACLGLGMSYIKASGVVPIDLIRLTHGATETDDIRPKTTKAQRQTLQYADEAYTNAYKIIEKHHSRNNRNIIMTQKEAAEILIKIGDLRAVSGRWCEAAAHWKESLDKLETHVGRNHSCLRPVLERLVIYADNMMFDKDRIDFNGRLEAVILATEAC